MYLHENLCHRYKGKFMPCFEAERWGEGRWWQRVLLASAASQLPSAPSNLYAEVTFLGMAILVPLTSSFPPSLRSFLPSFLPSSPPASLHSFLPSSSFFPPSRPLPFLMTSFFSDEIAGVNNPSTLRRPTPPHPAWLPSMGRAKGG